MPYKLWPPGTRKGNKRWLARGSVDGRQFEKILEAKTRAAAEAEAERFIGSLRAPSPGAVVTFEVAADAYMDGKDLGAQDMAYIDRLKRHFRGTPVGDIIGAHLTSAAHALASGTSNANKNRAVITPASSVLHFASEQGWCQERRFRRLPVSRRSNRKPVPAGTVQILLANTDGLQRLFLAWLYETGQRITASLHLMREDIDFARRIVKVTSDKTDDHGQIEISAELAAMLAKAPESATGRVFPWGDRHNVYRWLKPLCARLGVTYTPHQSRHAMATDLRALGYDMKAIAEQGLWRDERSAGRYVHHRSSAAPERGVAVLLGEVRGKNSTKARR